MDGCIEGVRRREGEWEQKFCCWFPVSHPQTFVFWRLTLSSNLSSLLLFSLFFAPSYSLFFSFVVVAHSFSVSRQPTGLAN